MRSALTNIPPEPKRFIAALSAQSRRRLGRSTEPDGMFGRGRCEGGPTIGVDLRTSLMDEFDRRRCLSRPVDGARDESSIVLGESRRCRGAHWIAGHELGKRLITQTVERGRPPSGCLAAVPSAHGAAPAMTPIDLGAETAERDH